MGKKLIVSNADCEHDNTEEFLEALETAGEVTDEFGAPITRVSYKGKVVITHSGPKEEAKIIVRDICKEYGVHGLKVRYA
jgi:hypothetical protein